MNNKMAANQTRSVKSFLPPFLLWGPISMIMEGVNFSLGMMTPGGDAQWIAALGVPRPLLLLTGSFPLVAGVKTISPLLTLIFSLLLAIFIVLSYKPISGNMLAIKEKTKSITWSATASSLVLGLSLFVFQLFIR